MLSGFFTWSQSNTFTIEFVTPKLESHNTGIIETYVKIKNNGNKELKGDFDAHSSHEDLYLVQRKAKPVVLQPSDSIFIPIKAIVSTTASAGNQCSIEAVFSVSGTDETKNIFLPVTIQEKKLVKMFLLETNLTYERAGDSLLIPVRITNEGNTAQTVTLLARFPNFIVRNILESTRVNIAPFTDTIITVKKQVTKSTLREEDFTITISTLYGNGDIAGTGIVRASSIKQDRRYSTEFSQDYAQSFSQSNQVTASYQYNNSNVAAYFLYANAEAELNGSLIKANIDVNWWENSDQVFVRNTWLSYKDSNYGITAGNISRFSDINLMGRGVEGHYKINDNDRIEAGAVDKSFNLADSPDTSFGESAWASFSHKDGWLYDKGYEAAIVYDNDSFNGISNALASSKFSIYKRQSITLRTAGAVSSSYAQADNENKAGGAGEILATGKINNLFYNSSNYISSGYFAGLRSGVVSLNERVTWSLDKYSVWGVFNYLDVSPKAFESQRFVSSQFTTARYDIGASRQFSSLTVSLSPYYYTENRTEQLSQFDGNAKYKMQAARLNFSAVYFNRPTSQNLALSTEGGIFTTNTTSGQEFHFKTNFNYGWKMFSVLAFYQYSNFYLGEIIANQQLGTNKKFYLFTLAPSAHVRFFDERVTLRAGMMYTSNSQINQMIQCTGRIDFDISKHFSLFLNGFYSKTYDNPYYVNTLQAGVTKRFNPIKIDKTTSNLEVYVYYNTSGKGPEDPLNIPAANQLIIINGKAFKTDDKGLLKYRSLPPGKYEIRPVNSNDWHAHSRMILLNEDTTIHIGINKTATIKGAISYYATEKSYQITKKTSGLSVIAIDDNGNVFNTRTDDNGNFVLYVPKGNYTVTLEKSGVSDYVEVEDNNRQVAAEPNEIQEVKFKLNIKEKRIETRKFTSRGFPSMPAEDKKKKK